MADATAGGVTRAGAGPGADVPAPWDGTPERRDRCRETGVTAEAVPGVSHPDRARDVPGCRPLPVEALVVGALVVGVGASKGAPAGDIVELVEAALREAGVSVRAVAELATVETKAAEPGIVAAAERLGVPLVTYSAQELSAVAVPNPSAAPLASVGTSSVAEAAALLGGGDLLVPKRKSGRATCAVVRRPGARPARAVTAGDDAVTAGDDLVKAHAAATVTGITITRGHSHSHAH
jgi:cobalt-precorrin 5A hydrolase/precorrin-3B C17-methyltransferase